MARNIRGRYVETPSSWRKMAAVGWRAPDDPTIYGTIDVDMTAGLAWLEELSRQTGDRLTVTHLVVRAVAEALARHPECNGMVRLGRVYLRDTVDISVLVAMPSGDGHDQRVDLSETVLREVDRMSVCEIARAVAEGARRIRANQDPFLQRTKQLFDRLPPALLKIALKVATFAEYQLNLDLSGLGIPRDPFGSAIVTSVGMLGISEAFAPIPPFSGVAALVAVGRVEERPVVRDGEVVARPMMTLTATFDHRLIDGFQGGRLARTFTEVMEDPRTHLA